MVIAVLVRLYPVDGPTRGSVTFNAGDTLAVASVSESLWNVDKLFISRDQAPLKYVILHYFLYLGRNESIIRLPAFLFGIASIFLTYLLGKLLFGSGVGLLSSFILAISPWHIQHSCYSEMYTLYVFFSLLSVYYFCQSLENESIWRGGMFALSSILGFYSFYPFVIIIIGEFMAYVFLYKRKRMFIFILFFIIAVFLLWAFKDMCTALAWKRNFGDYHWGWKLPEALPELLSVFGGVAKFIPLNVFIFLYGLIIAFRQNALRKNGLLLFIISSAAFLFFYGCLLFKMNVTQRYFLFIYPFFVIISSVGMLNSKNNIINALIILLFNVSLPLLLLSKMGFVATKFLPHDYIRRDTDFSLLARYLEDNYKDGDAVVIEQEGGIFALQYYLDKDNIYPVKIIMPYCGRNKRYYRYDGERIKNLFGLIELNDTPSRLNKIWKTYGRLWLVDINHLDYEDRNGEIENWINENSSHRMRFYGAVVYLFEEKIKKLGLNRDGEEYRCDKLICYLDCKGIVRSIAYPFQAKNR